MKRGMLSRLWAQVEKVKIVGADNDNDNTMMMLFMMMTVISHSNNGSRPCRGPGS
jgi:hypothetical protein